MPTWLAPTRRSTSAGASAVIRRHDDIEDKLAVAVDDRQRGVEAITAAVAFQEAGWDSEVVVAP